MSKCVKCNCLLEDYEKICLPCLLEAKDAEIARLRAQLEATGMYLQTARDGWRDTQKELAALKAENAMLRERMK